MFVNTIQDSMKSIENSDLLKNFSKFNISSGSVEKSSINVYQLQNKEIPRITCYSPKIQIAYNEECSQNDDEGTWEPLLKRNSEKIRAFEHSYLSEFPYFFSEQNSYDSKCMPGCVDVSMKSHKEAYSDIITCMELARNIPASRYCTKEIFHVFWDSLPVASHLVWYILSYLVTQDLEYSTLWIWSAPGQQLELSPELSLFKNHANIKFKEFNYEIIPSYISLKFVRQVEGVIFTDLFRVLVLHIYGGLYVDADFFFLRNLGPLLGSEWLYQWGSHCYDMNGAVMRLFKNSTLSFQLLSAMQRTPPSSGSITVWGRDLYSFVNHILPIRKYPTCFFNPNWLTGSNYLSANANSYIWNGAFGVHLHGSIFKHSHKAASNSDYTRVREEICTKLKIFYSLSVFEIFCDFLV